MESNFKIIHLSNRSTDGVPLAEFVDSGNNDLVIYQEPGSENLTINTELARTDDYATANLDADMAIELSSLLYNWATSGKFKQEDTSIDASRPIYTIIPGANDHDVDLVVNTARGLLADGGKENIQDAINLLNGMRHKIQEL